MSKRSETARRLNCTFRIGKWGVKLFGAKLNGGHHIIQVTSLDGWIFDTNVIAQSFADDPAFKIKRDR